MQIHGEERTAWTKITQTVEKTRKTFDSKYDLKPSNRGGIAIYEFNSAGEMLNLTATFKLKEMAPIMANVQAGSVLVVLKHNYASTGFFDQLDL